MGLVQASSYTLTCTFCATFTVATITTAVEAPICVSTACILVTVVQVIILTLVNICTIEMAAQSLTTAASIVEKYVLTVAI